MRLKSIEITGFKSFPDKIELEFPKGITCVVGPNGSGKSNISDAIRWVMGEQSVKMLRGGKMEDVIFSGTQKRKPLGFCEVGILVDNADKTLPIDFDEILVTRRLFRSGESEYYINKSGCRLKDIQELFMDTGLGKDGYSLVGQGRIDGIINGKPSERRTFFEEACGISKYRHRKDEAERKLAQLDPALVVWQCDAPGLPALRQCVRLAESSEAVFLLLVRPGTYATVWQFVQAAGICVMSWPAPQEVFRQTLRNLLLLKKSLRAMQEKTDQLQSQLQDMKRIQKAKSLLMNQLGMSEADAHRWIEKAAMDRCVKKREIAETIIRMYAL